MNCKVRFAPSPTGFMHVGNARIAIINYLFAKKNGGKFLFRIDDTDSVRSKKEYEDAIREDLKWLGIGYDETFRQSEKYGRYKEVREVLAVDEMLYKCFESPEELEYKRRLAISKGAPPIYDRASLQLPGDKIRELESSGIKPYWRFKLPDTVVSWNDGVLGMVSYDLRNLSDPVIIKADGTYLYSFSSVVDDFDSGITHIIRGQDHVTNTAAQIAMFNAIAKKEHSITFAHLSLLINKDGSQFSKRLGGMNLKNLRDEGIDPMAISNIMATLGSSLDTVPFQKIEDLIEYFDISKFSSNSPKFDIDDVVRLNRKILRSKQYNDVEKYGISKEVFEVIKENIDFYNDFTMWNNVVRNDYVSSHIPSQSEKSILEAAEREISQIGGFSEKAIKEIFEKIKNLIGISGKDLYVPIRLALTGMDHGPNLEQLLILFGRDEVLRRLKSICQ
jgi:glutamyl-tRNA synthetase